jgi:hypothetical protein
MAAGVGEEEGVTDRLRHQEQREREEERKKVVPV